MPLKKKKKKISETIDQILFLTHSIWFGLHHSLLVYLTPPGLLLIFSYGFFSIHHLGISFKVQSWVFFDFLLSSVLICSLCLPLLVHMLNYHLHVDDY